MFKQFGAGISEVFVGPGPDRPWRSRISWILCSRASRLALAAASPETHEIYGMR